MILLGKGREEEGERGGGGGGGEEKKKKVKIKILSFSSSPREEEKSWRALRAEISLENIRDFAFRCAAFFCKSLCARAFLYPRLCLLFAFRLKLWPSGSQVAA